MGAFSRWFCLFSLVAVYASASNPSQDLTPSEHNPLYLLFLNPSWQSLGERGDTESTFGIYTHYTNIFERRANDRYFQDFDGEMLSTHAFLSRSLSRRLGFKIQWSAHRYSGGFLDSSIQSFHDTFDLANDDRDLVMNDRRIMRLQQSNGTVLFDAAPHEWHVTNPHVTLSWRFAHRDRWSSSLGVTAKLPLGSGPFHNDNPDVALNYHGRSQGKRWAMDFQVGALSLSAPDTLEPITKNVAGYAKIWVERTWFKRLVTFAELNGASAYFHQTGLNTLDLEPFNLIVGLSMPVTPRAATTLTFGEDISAEGPALDFHINWGIVFRF